MFAKLDRVHHFRMHHFDVLRRGAAVLMIGLLSMMAMGTAQASAAPVGPEQIRTQWATAKKAYQDKIAPFASLPEHAEVVKKYTAALEAAEKSLDAYIKLKQATPPAPPAQLTPVMDQLYKNLRDLKTLQGQAKGGLTTVLGNALREQQMITQTALKNMR